MSQLVAEEIEDQIDDASEEVEELETEEVVEEVVEEAADQPDETVEEEAAEEEEELEISIGDESLTSEEDDSSNEAPVWVKDLRAQNREQAKQNRQLKEELEKLKQPQVQEEMTLGKEPELEDFDYDADKFKKALTSHYEKKREIELKQLDEKRVHEEQAREWDKKLQSYETRKKELKVRDYEESEEVALHLLDNTQQNIILQGAEDPALLVYAIGKNAKRAEELSKIKDPIKFTWNLAKLEKDLKVSKRSKVKSQPEKTIKGNSSKSGVVDAQIKRLEAEASKTGNMNKLLAYERKQRAKKK